MDDMWKLRYGTVRCDFVKKAELFSYLLSHIVFRYTCCILIVSCCVFFVAVQCLADQNVIHVVACPGIRKRI
jgi:hypothetical protein